MRTDGQTDMTYLIAAFRNIANARKMIKSNNESQSVDNQSHEEGNRDNSRNFMCTICSTDICIVFNKISVESITLCHKHLENHLASLFHKQGESILREPTSVCLYMQVTVAVGVHAS